MSETTQKVAELKKALDTGPYAVNPSQFALDAAYVIPTSHVLLPPGVPLEALLAPEAWTNIAAKLRIRQRILVDTVDGSFSALLRVVETKGVTPDRPVIVVTVESYKQERAEELPDAGSPADGYRVHFAGGAKWRITRKSDGSTISDGHASRVVAEDVLRGHLQAKAA